MYCLARSQQILSNFLKSIRPSSLRFQIPDLNRQWFWIQLNSIEFQIFPKFSLAYCYWNFEDFLKNFKICMSNRQELADRLVCRIFPKTAPVWCFISFFGKCAPGTAATLNQRLTVPLFTFSSAPPSCAAHRHHGPALWFRSVPSVP